jgi:hypothetical protein
LNEATSGDELVRQVLRLALDPAVQAGSWQAASPTAWAACVARLEEHRLLQLAHDGLSRAGLIGELPAVEAKKLQGRYAYCKAVNGMLWFALEDLSRRLQKVGVTPVACKGVVLSALHYPDSGLRFMTDLDLWVSGEQREASHRVLLEAGYERIPEKSLPDGDNYINRAGVVVDLHSRMRLFERVGGFHALSEGVPQRSFRVFEPHALLAHLCAHMSGHLFETGLMLCWLIDLGYVMQRVGERVDFGRLRGLMGAPSHWFTFLSTLRFLNEELGMPVPTPALERARSVAPLRLESILRMRRLATWGVPAPRGWARLLAALAGVRSDELRSVPSWAELAHLPADLAEQWRVTQGRPSA